MAETYRPPKAVRAEIDLPPVLSAAQVSALRDHVGQTGAWARGIVHGLEQRAALIKEITMETRALPPSLRPSTDADVPTFTPSCETCEYFRGGIQTETIMVASVCEKWDAAVEATSYCDAWESRNRCLPSWLRDDDVPAEEVAWYSATPEAAEVRRSQVDSCEKRSFATEVRATTAEDGTVTMRGYAAVFDQEATGLPFREVIRRGAFKRSLDRGDECYLLINHNTDELPLARRSSGTLEVSEDDHGLLVEAELDPANPRAAELISALSRSDVSEMSFAFKVAPGGSSKGEDGLRELTDLDLFEASVTTWGAYSQTDVGLRDADVADGDFLLRWRAAELRARLLGL
jgi:HK97 family phage prohead protease